MTTPTIVSAGERERRAWLAAVVVTVLATLIRLLFAARLPLFPDETYYWEWSRRLAGGYFDHPPMIAMLIRAGTAFGEPTPLGVRFVPVLAGGITGLATSAIAWRLAGGMASVRAAVLFALMPLAATGLVLATPDSPLLATSAVGLYCVVRALQSAVGSRSSLRWWSAAGVALGLAFTSKYTAILLPVTIAIAVLARPSLRARLREPGPFVACVLATLIFLPVLQWNAAHDWISFQFQIQHGLGAAKGSPLKRELDLIGGQLGLVSPILFALMAHAVWRTLRRPLDDARFALAVVAVGSWVFFAYSATRRSVEPNWPAPSYIPGVVLLAIMTSTAGHQRWLRRGVALAMVLVIVLYVHALVPVLPLPARRDPLARNAGWADVAAQVDRARRAAIALPTSRAAKGVRRVGLAKGVRRAAGESELGFGLGNGVNPRSGALIQPPLPNPRRTPYAPRRATRRTPFAVRWHYYQATAWVGADRYQDASELAYHLPGHPVVMCTCLRGRRNQYELWPSFADAARVGDALVLLLDERDGVHETSAALAPYFSVITRGELAPLLRGVDTVSVRRIWVLENYRGGWPARDAP